MQITSHLIYAAVAFCLFLSCAIFSNILGVMIIAEINRKRPETNQVSYFGSTLPKTISIFKEYRASFPGGRLHIYFVGCCTAALVFLFAIAVLIGFR
jgi:hypothetical protein